MEEKPPNNGILNLNLVGKRQDFRYLFLLFPFGHSGSCFLTSSPCGKAKTMITQVVYADRGVHKQLRFPHNLNLQRASSKQDIKHGSARLPLPFPHPPVPQKKGHFHRWQVAPKQVSVTETPLDRVTFPKLLSQT